MREYLTRNSSKRCPLHSQMPLRIEGIASRTPRGHGVLELSNRLQGVLSLIDHHIGAKHPDPLQRLKDLVHSLREAPAHSLSLVAELLQGVTFRGFDLDSLP